MYADREALQLPDVQSSADQRQLAIQRVGVKSVRYPVLLEGAGPDGAPMSSVAMVDMYVGLPMQEKGTHMSRFLEVLQALDEPVGFASVQALMRSMLNRLEAESGTIAMRMPWFALKHAPVSGVPSLMDYELSIRLEHENGKTRFFQQVTVPVTSLCPCSRDISRYGAHNQRSHLTLTVELVEPMPVLSLVRIAEDAASCELYGLLKRPDEKYVTERAYENPKFVEDLVRDVALVLNTCPQVVAYTVESENFESIHNHSAYARLEHDKRKQKSPE